MKYVTVKGDAETDRFILVVLCNGLTAVNVSFSTAYVSIEFMESNTGAASCVGWVGCNECCTEIEGVPEWIPSKDGTRDSIVAGAISSRGGTELGAFDADIVGTNDSAIGLDTEGGVVGGK